MKNDLISIVVPVYNVEDYLDACITSILEQTYENIEIILVDDGATDHSGQMCDYYEKKDKRIKVIHKENGGLSDARNVGILHAKGRYVVFVDSDDIVSHNLIEYLYKLIDKNLADIGICDPVHCYPEHEIIFEKETKQHSFHAEDAIVEMLYQKTFLVSAWGKIFKKEYFDELTFPYGMLFEDSAIMYKVFEKADKIVYGNARLYGYMHRENSITTRKFSKRDCDILIICNQIVEHMRKKSIKLQKAARSYQISAALRIYMNAPRNGEFDAELKYCELILKENSVSVLQDYNIRKKLRMALLLHKFARPIMPIVYKRINRWS